MPEPSRSPFGTWNGVELSRADVDGWLALDTWKLRSCYDSQDPTLAWVVLQKP